MLLRPDGDPDRNRTVISLINSIFSKDQRVKPGNNNGVYVLSLRMARLFIPIFESGCLPLTGQVFNL
jgi:hypothetical protein